MNFSGDKKSKQRLNLEYNKKYVLEKVRDDNSNEKKIKINMYLIFSEITLLVIRQIITIIMKIPKMMKIR